MAKIVTLQVLVDDDDEARITQGLNDMFSAASRPVDPDQETYGWLLDYRVADKAGNLCMTDAPAEIADAVVNETYQHGDAFPTNEIALAPGVEYTFGQPGLADDCSGWDTFGSFWVTIPKASNDLEEGDLSLYIRRTHEGVIVEAYPAGGEDDLSLASLAVEYTEAGIDPQEMADNNERLVAASDIEVSADPDQPGMFLWHGAEVSFPTREEAVNGAAQAVAVQVMGFHDLSPELWNGLGVERKLELVKEACAPDEPIVAPKRRSSSPGLGM